jgi:chorismate mutase / prephenate dehydratase
MAEHRRDREELRQHMAEADGEILRALQKRARLARQIRELGGATQPIPGGTEQELLQKLEAAGASDLPPDAVRAVFREVHAATAALERPARVTFVRPEGGYAEVVARIEFGAAADLAPVDTVPAALDEVTRHRADFAVIPVESSLDGPMHESVEALAATELLLIAKLEIAAVLSLMSKPGAGEHFDKVYAFGRHRVAAQAFLATLGGTVAEAASPLAAAKLALEDEAVAALVPESFGAQVGLSVVASNVADRATLKLRFGVISVRPTWRSGNDMTALLFGVHDEPGALFDVLRHFAERGINVKTIQSRPMPGESWTYQFYTEVSGHVTDRTLVTAIEEIKRKTRFIKVLGSFPAC